MSSKLTNKSIRLFFIVSSSLLLLFACGNESTSTQSGSAPVAVASNVSESDLAIDANIKSQVESALANASDLPESLTVAVTEGAVLISGSVVCENCGGMRTPGNIGTIQQSLGGVVRAVPGVMRVNFDLSYGSD